MTALVIFILSYIGIALGKVPGLVMDRTGIALLGAIAMVVFGVITPESAFHAIDLPTILLLYSLMIISAQFRLGGFYTWAAKKITSQAARPKIFLLLAMLVSAVLSALLANDIVCFAFTPVLAVALLDARLNPLPYLLGLAISSNIGSAATIIGNPQNMLIGQTGNLDFLQFFLWCGPPSLLALLLSYLLLLLLFGGNMQDNSCRELQPRQQYAEQPFNGWQTAKGLAALLVLMVLFLTPVPREISAVGVAGVLLCSRRMRTRDITSLIDWHLITLFCALFIIIHGISESGFLADAIEGLQGRGVDLYSLPILATVTAVASNIFSNVPAVMLLTGALDQQQPLQWYTLALSSTFAGNLFLLGSIANLIVVEQAAAHGIRISFQQHAKVGILVTCASFFVLFLWL
jgi:Na+/H+ antiporter NhaD/arsenite permease-like protein